MELKLGTDSGKVEISVSFFGGMPEFPQRLKSDCFQLHGDRQPVSSLALFHHKHVYDTAPCHVIIVSHNRQ